MHKVWDELPAQKKGGEERKEWVFGRGGEKEGGRKRERKTGRQAKGIESTLTISASENTGKGKP